jgi:hypothetical protein
MTMGAAVFYGLCIGAVIVLLVLAWALRESDHV